MVQNDDFKGYAGFWRRFFAYLIDILVIIFIDLLLVSDYLLSIESESEIEINIINIIVHWLYFSIMESSILQATIGKISLGIKVTDLSGNRLSFYKATGRFFGKLISNLIIFIGFLMIAFTKKKQGLHDIIIGSVVVKR